MSHTKFATMMRHSIMMRHGVITTHTERAADGRFPLVPCVMRCGVTGMIGVGGNTMNSSATILIHTTKSQSLYYHLDC
jgi:hypothetical protein